MTYLDLDELRLPEKRKDINWWADHVEFFCLLAQDRIVTVDQIVDRLLDENSNQASKAIKSLPAYDEVDDFDADDETSDYDIDPDGDDDGDDTFVDSVSSDALAPRVQRFFQFLARRQAIFGEAYPFVVNTRSIANRADPLSPSQYLYTVLLCSSLLKYATKSGVNLLGHHFEQLCGPIFKRLVPYGTTVKFFGSGTSQAEGFTGTFHHKVSTLAEMLHLQLGGDFTPGTMSSHNVGDGGLDWVGFYDFGDGQKFQPKFFAQCACGTNWVDKQFDAHFDKWSRYMQFDNLFLLYHFIPRSLRSTSGEFVNPTEIFKVTMIDRLRIIQILQRDRRLGHILSEIYLELINELEDKKLDLFS